MSSQKTPITVWIKANFYHNPWFPDNSRDMLRDRARSRQVSPDGSDITKSYPRRGSSRTSQLRRSRLRQCNDFIFEPIGVFERSYGPYTLLIGGL